MATDGPPGRPYMDYPAHLATYRLFTSLIRYGAAAVAIVLVLLALFTL
ncbi:MAG TPA: aa3-type cytochrome c oxidase subunit IV [Rhodoblastus sp.]|nr:aa3-type cytochrome c oxidase subunit IV [Rhodoblastus sp.]